MQIIEENVLLSHLNDGGDRIIIFPITKPECIEGLDLKIKTVSESSFKGINSGTLLDIGILQEGGNSDGN